MMKISPAHRPTALALARKTMLEHVKLSDTYRMRLYIELLASQLSVESHARVEDEEQAEKEKEKK